MDLNAYFDDLVERIADRVVEKLNSNPGNWPGPVETKGVVTAAGITASTPPWVVETVSGEDKAEDIVSEVARLSQEEDEGVDDPGDEVVGQAPLASIDDQPTRMTVRREFWSGQDVRNLRKALSEYEGEDIGKYKIIPKKELVEMAASLETLTGHDLDAKVVEPEPEEFTYEEALKTDLAELKAIAVENGVDADKLVGLDVDAVADLLFEPEVELTAEEVMDLDFAGLMKLAAEYDVEVPDNIARQDLALKILDKVSE
jgi:hypothetical protein